MEIKHSPFVRTMNVTLLLSCSPLKTYFLHIKTIRMLSYHDVLEALSPSCGHNPFNNVWSHVHLWRMRGARKGRKKGEKLLNFPTNSARRHIYIHVSFDVCLYEENEFLQQTLSAIARCLFPLRSVEGIDRESS